MGNRFSDLTERINPSQEENDNNNNQNNSGSNISNTNSRRRNPTRSTDHQSQASPYSATPNRSNPSIHSERVTRLLNSLREANQSQNVLVQLQRAQNNRTSSRRRRSLSATNNPLTEPTNFPHLPDMADFIPSLNLLNSQVNSNDNSSRDSSINIADHPLFSSEGNSLPPSLFSGTRNLQPGIPLPSLLNAVPFPLFNPQFPNQNNQETRPVPETNSVNGPTEAPGQNFQTRHQDLNRLLAAAIRAISLTATENQQSNHNSTRSEGAATPAAFMESFLQNLTQNSNNNVSEPVPRLSLITQASGNDDPSSASIVRVFRLERNENTELETNAQTNNNQTSESTESNNEQSSAVPVLMIVIRSLTDPNNQNNTNSTQHNSNSTDSTQSTTTAEPRIRLSNLQERILREHEAAHANRTNANSDSAQADAGSETPFTDSQRRSWIIYVIGSTYPPDHPLFSSLYSENPSYEDLLALTNILGPVVPQTTTQANVEKHLPIYHFDSSIPGIPDHKMIHIDRCQVCLEDFLDKESIRLLACSHGFHKDCIDKWLTKGCNKCPVCRSKAVPNIAAKPSDPSLDNPDNTATAN